MRRASLAFATSMIVIACSSGDGSVAPAPGETLDASVIDRDGANGETDGTTNAGDDGAAPTDASASDASDGSLASDANDASDGDAAPPCTPGATQCVDRGEGIRNTELLTCDTNQRWVSSTCAGRCAEGMCTTNTCDARGAQNLVVILGETGAHGYAGALFPQPEAFQTNRFSDHVPVHALQTTANGGSGAIANLTNAIAYDAPPAESSTTRGMWAAGERFKRYYGVDNLGFGGFRSANAASRALDDAAFTVTTGTVPTNASLTADKKAMIVTRETPWYVKYGLRKAVTRIEGGKAVAHGDGTDVAWVNRARGISLFDAVTNFHRDRVTVMPGPFFVGATTGRMGVGVGPRSAPAVYATGGSTMIAAFNVANPGLGLDSQLTPSAADRTRYGYTGTNTQLSELRDSFIITAKMLALGVGSQFVIALPQRDLHGAFTAAGTDGLSVTAFAVALSNFLNAFMDDLSPVSDPFCPALKLHDNTVVAFLGDTPRSSVVRDGWSDAPLSGQNRVYVMSNGLLKSGSFGGERPLGPTDITPQPDPTLRGPGEGGLYDRVTGDMIPFDATGALGMVGGVDRREEYGETAMAAILYAISRGNPQVVNRFYAGAPFPAIQVPALL